MFTNGFTAGAAEIDAIDALLLGKSRAMEELRSLLRFVARANVPVLIMGPSGTGKELVAAAIHLSSPRGDQPLVAVNSGAIPRELIESELFGHEKGAFTGATQRRIGHFEQAEGGTLFLDEIGEMPLETQVRLLRVLESHSFRRVGGDRDLAANVRIIAATHRCMDSALETGAFREDLFYRLCVLPIHVPALCDRREDIPMLVEHFLDRFAKDSEAGHGAALPRFTDCALATLEAHDWPGNVRELRNLVTRAATLFPGSVIDAAMIDMLLNRRTDALARRPVVIQPAADQDDRLEQPEALYSPAKDLGAPIALNAHLEREERRLLLQALDRSNGVIAAAARMLAIRRTTMIEKMRRHGISSADRMAA